MVLQPGQILEGDLFNEPMRVETVNPEGPGRWTVGLVGLYTEKYRKVSLTETDIVKLRLRPPTASYHGNPSNLRLGIHAYILGIAYEFDPYFGLSVSRVDPLPHQLEAVYDYLLKSPRIRFLLADDAGAGKTIMAGLLIKELKLRGLAERILIVCPANLTFQWMRELYDKFGEKFEPLKGSDLRENYAFNPWTEQNQIITSMDLARMEHVLPSLKQAQWDLVVIDEAHRMSAYREDNKTQRYRLGEMLRDSTSHLLMLTATPHRGDPENFSLFLRLLDKDAYADIVSIQSAMAKKRAAFYLRRTKEAMVYFPEKQPDGTWAAKKIFTKRLPETAKFNLSDMEFRLYCDVTRFLKVRAAMAAAKEETDPRAKAVGFLVTLFQRRLASSTMALKSTLERRVNRLEKKLQFADDLLKEGDLNIPSDEELEDMDDERRELWEDKIEAITFARNPEEVREEIEELKQFAERAQEVIDSGTEAKLTKLHEFLNNNAFLADPKKRLLIFTEFKDTLTYLVEKLKSWGFSVGFIHGGMKSGDRDQPGTRLYTEAQFRANDIQILVATEAAGEGINLQCCHIMINYDIPWNPNRLEQRMGRIHRYGQTEDCLIFNFVAANTTEGKVLETLLDRLQEIRNALDDDAVFNVIGEILPATEIERVFRDYYAQKLGAEDLEERLLRNVNVEKFREICQNALENLATKKLNLSLLVERRAKAREKRMVPETMARFLSQAAGLSGMVMKSITDIPFSFEPGPTPTALRRFENLPDWKLLRLSNKYPRITTERKVSDDQKYEWVTPGHPLFESLRRNVCEVTRTDIMDGACYYSLNYDHPVRLDIYRARIRDGLDNVVHERLFGVEVSEGVDPIQRDPSILGDLQPAKYPETLPPVAYTPEATAFLHDKALAPFLEEVRKERIEETDRIAEHIELSLTELIAHEDRKIGQFTEEKEAGLEGAAGRLAFAEQRHSELINRREKRRQELARQKEMAIHNVERMTTILILPHPDRDKPEFRNLRYDPVVEAIAMRVAMEYEVKEGRKVEDVHEQDLGYDITGLNLNSGELRLIEVKGLSASDGEIILTPNEHREANDRRDCYWLYLVTECKTHTPKLHLFKDPAKYDWIPVKKIEHFIRTFSKIRLED